MVWEGVGGCGGRGCAQKKKAVGRAKRYDVGRSEADSVWGRDTDAEEALGLIGGRATDRETETGLRLGLGQVPRQAVAVADWGSGGGYSRADGTQARV